jgi:hypothetical protein
MNLQTEHGNIKYVNKEVSAYKFSSIWTSFSKILNYLNKCQSTYYLTLSSPVMPFGIILLILFFIWYNFWGLERVNPFQSKKIVAFLGWKGFNPF